MSKFNQQTQAGSNVVLDTPVAELEQRLPEPQQPEEQGGSLDDLLGPTESFEQIEAREDQQIEYDTQPPEIQAQRQAEAITPIHQRRTEDRVDKFEAVKTPEATADFGLDERSNVLINRSNSPDIREKIQVTGLAPILNQTGAQRNPNAFLKTLSYTTENFMADLALGESELDFQTLTDEEAATVERLPTTDKGLKLQPQSISKAQGNQKLGQDIHREYQRLQNSIEGRPTDDYVDLSPEDATVLGDMAKEMYYEANKDNMARVVGPDRQVYFTPSSKLQEDFARGANYRKRLFPKQHVRPAKNPLPQGQFVGEGRQITKAETGKVGKGNVNAKVIKQAAANMNKIGNVVDKQRSRILLSTMLPALMHRGENYGSDPMLDAFAEINNFGPSKVKKFKGAEKVARLQGNDKYSWQENLRSLKGSIAQSLLGIAQERNGINYLTYGMQAFNGRLAPQQTHFDPTTSKAVRFVTRNPNLVTVKPGSRQEANLIQMYALIIGSKGTDALLPGARVDAMKRQAPELEAWGKRMIAILDNSMSDADVDGIFQLIEQGVPLTDPQFQALVKPLALDPERDADLLKAIRDKGEDGPAFIDGLIDFAKYQAAKRRGVPHITGFNAYIDGKTNGIASNGIQMGSREVAMRTGVIRNPDFVGPVIHAVDQDVDIRDEMMQIMLDSVDMNGFDGDFGDSTDSMYTLAKAILGHRDLAKSTTMTFGYGKDIPSFKQDIEDTAYELAEGNPAVAEALADLQENGIEWNDAILGKYAEGLRQVMSWEAIESRHMMWGVAAMNAMADELMTLKSYTGLELRFGDTVTAGEIDKTKYKIYGAGTTDAREVGARQYGTKATSAAPRTRTKEVVNEVTGEIETQTSTDFGGWAWGGAVPGPVQSLDAATIAMSVTGDSWKKLNQASQGKPYFHSIYDAIKMDANGYDVVLDQVNANWLKAAMEWSYLKEARDSFDKAEKAFNDKLKGKSDDALVDIREEFPFIADLLDPSGSSSGAFANKLYKKLKALLPIPEHHKTADAQHQYILDKTNDFVDALNLKLSGNGPATLSVKQIKRFQKMFFGEAKLKQRLDKLIHATEKNKKELEQEIKRDPNLNAQYYTH